MLRQLIVLAVLLGAVSAARADGELSGVVTLSTFDGPLSAHGEWVVAGGHGRVWRPHHVYAGWRPYLDGHWVWTDEGWLWVSDEPWAWATYHYGRWSWEPGWGWVWVPGYEWAPAWVEWRYSAGCVGWAPLFPVGYLARHVAYEHWTFVASHSFVGVHARAVAWSHRRVREHWHSTTTAPGWHERGQHDGRAHHGSPASVHQAAPAFGPPRHFVERETGRPLQAVRPVQVSSPSQLGRQRGAPEVFRPSRGQRGATVAPAPSSGPTPPQRRDLRPQPARKETWPTATRSESRPTASRPEPRPMATRQEARPMASRPEPRPMAVRQEARPVASRPEAVRGGPRPAYRSPESSRSAPQRLAPQAPAAARPSAGAAHGQRQVVPQAQPTRKPAGSEGRRRR